MKTRYAYCDIETTEIIHNSPYVEKIHFAMILKDDDADADSENATFYDTKNKFNRAVKTLEQQGYEFVFHNGHNFDLIQLKHLWGTKFNNEVHDTLLLSRLIFPNLRDSDDLEPKKLNGSHSLRAWGQRFKFPKGDFNGPWENFDPEMVPYCEQDCKITRKLHQYILKQKSDGNELYNEKQIQIESNVHAIMAEAKEHGMRVSGLQALKTMINDDYNDALEQLGHEGFTGNPNSRIQVYQYLMEHDGWEPTIFTPTGRPKVSPETLPTTGIGKAFKKYYATQKPLSQVETLFKFYNTETNRIYPTVAVAGTRTTRASHYNPNLAQIPALTTGETRWDRKYGEEFRNLFRPDHGKVLVGSDLSSLEVRCMAENLYQYTDDKTWIDLIEQGLDIHEHNRQRVGFNDRTDAKRVLFATIYGAGIEKVGSIITGSYDQRENVAIGRKTLNMLWNELTSLRELKNICEQCAKITKTVRTHYGHTIWVGDTAFRGLNTLLQGMGADIAKQWIVNMYPELHELDANIHLWVHDEVQISVPEKNVEKLKKVLTRAIEKVKVDLDTKINWECDISVGKSWRETH